MTTNKSPPDQSSMFAAFEQADFERETSHLPATIEEAIPYFRELFTRYDAAILAGNGDEADRVEKEAENLAIRLNGGTHFGIKASEDSPCNILERATAAPDGQPPLWGQQGIFILDVKSCRIRIELDGLYGICLPAFSMDTVHRDA